MTLFILGLAIILTGGIIALLPGLSRRLENLISTLVMAGGCAISLAGTLGAFTGAPQIEFIIQWNIPGAEIILGLDPLSALFLSLHFLVAGSTALFGRSYFSSENNKGFSLPLTHFFLSLLIVSMAVTFSARHAVLFLAAWEVMAVSAFFLIIYEHQRSEVRKAGTLYMAATHAGLLCLIGVFILLGAQAGSYRFSAMAGNPAIYSVGPTVFFLALAGFGLKAGFMPLHVWLPEAHPAAPSPVSALMSGVMIKTGIYGLIRVISFFPSPPVWWGLVLLTLGISSGILGVLWAIAQHDFKRLLAYHSIENIGIIAIGIGIGLLGLSLGNPTVALLGMTGGLLHVVNHGLFKSLLFLGAGSVFHATGIRDMDQMGGLWKKMPFTGLFVLIGSAAICGLPPLNGFVSEWLIYMGSFHLGKIDVRPYFLLIAPALALIGALALACFTKAFAVQFLGAPRSNAPAQARESDIWMTAPMAILAAACCFIGFLPGLIFPSVSQSAMPALGSPLIANDSNIQNYIALLTKLSWCSLGLIVFVCLLVFLRRRLLSPSEIKEACTWGCGYANVNPRMQYTSSSYAQFVVRIFRQILLPVVNQKSPSGYFPRDTHFSSHTPDAVLDRFLKTNYHRCQRWFSYIQSFHEGHVQSYLAYLLIFLFILLLWQFHGLSVFGRYLFLLDFSTGTP